MLKSEHAFRMNDYAVLFRNNLNRRELPMKLCRALALAVICLCFGVCTTTAFAGSIVLGESKTIVQPTAVTQTSIEFFLDRTGADDGTPLSVGNYQVRISLTGAGVGSTARIVGAGATTGKPQAFVLDTKNVTAGTSAYVATLNLAHPFDVADGAGLLKVDLEFQPGAQGVYLLSAQPGAGNTEFTSPVNFSSLLAVESGNGSVTVLVPEPSTVAFVLAGVAFAAAVRKRRCTEGTP